MSALISVLLSGQLLGKVASNAGLTLSSLRVLGLVSVLGEGGRIVDNASVAEMLGRSDVADVRRDTGTLARLGMIEKVRRTKSAIGWVVLPAGARVLGVLEREERAVRRKVREYNAGMKIWARPYQRTAAWYASRGKQGPDA